jgi:hypothetical protein
MPDRVRPTGGRGVVAHRVEVVVGAVEHDNLVIRGTGEHVHLQLQQVSGCAEPSGLDDHRARLRRLGSTRLSKLSALARMLRSSCATFRMSAASDA